MNPSKAIKIIREKFGYTQEDLASRLGVSFTSVNRWETGKSNPRKDTAKRIEELLQKAIGERRPVERKGRQPKAYSLFSGAGGFHLGMEAAGFDVVLGLDLNPHAEKTHKENWPDTPFVCEDIRKVTPEMLLEASGGKKPDFVFGGPPCQGFSTLGDKLSCDPRNELFGAYFNVVSGLSPKCFLMENVKALSTMYKGRFLKEIIRKFTEEGYAVYKTIINAADYGVPQVRNRVFLFGTRLDQPFVFPRKTHGCNGDKTLKRYVTVGEAIMDLVDKGDEVSNHIALNHSDVVVRRYQYIPEGGRLPAPEELPEDIRRKNFGNTYKRLHRKKPSLTMVPGNNAFPVHPVLDRSLTPREAARIQTFPDSFVFVGDRRNQCILVGNAVPPLLGEVLGRQVLAHMAGDIREEDKQSPERVIVANSSKYSQLEASLSLPDLQAQGDEMSFVDLFAGAGGFTIGFSRAGWKPLLCVDNNKSVVETHAFNYPNVPFLNADLSEEEVQSLVIEAAAGKDVGVIVGGPPCQGFSVFGKRRFVNTRGYDPHKDPRNKLVYSYLALVERIQPRWFVMENVPGLANLDNGLFLEAVVEEFKSIGYDNTEWMIMNCADYGVPQLRKRLVVVGNRTGHIIPWPKKKFFNDPKDWQDKYRTVGEVISDLSTEKSYEKQTCHVPMKHKPLLVERYTYIPEGGRLNVQELPDHLKFGYRTDKVKNYSHIFKRLHREKPSITMVPGHNAFPIHPWLNRALTVREAARIQTFPDAIEFKGSRQNQCIQVGNAFPPLLAEVLAANIKKAEINGWVPGDVPPLAYYSLVEKPEERS